MIKRYRKYRSYGHGRVIAALNAPPLGWLLALAAALGLLFGLGGCGSVAYDPSLEREAAQGVLDNLRPACRDGVQYLASPHEAHKAVVPRMKPDGTLYRCKIINEPQRVVEEWEQ